MIVERLLRRAILGLAVARGGPALLRRARLLALRAALSLLLLRRGLPGALDALATDPGGVASARDRGRDCVAELALRLPTTCLWRALAGYAALRRRGRSVQFILGVRTDGPELHAHAWLEERGRPLAQRGDPRSRFQVAFTHPAPAPDQPEEHDMTELTPLPEVILTELEDGSGVLLHLGTKFYYALNATGVAVWKLLGDGIVEPDALARNIAARFAGTSEAQAHSDVMALLQELRAEGLAPDRCR